MEKEDSLNKAKSLSLMSVAEKNKQMRAHGSLQYRDIQTNVKRLSTGWGKFKKKYDDRIRVLNMHRSKQQLTQIVGITNACKKSYS